MNPPHRFVLAVSASPRGFAFVLFRGENDPFDWGLKDIRGNQKNARCVGEIKRLIRRYHPEQIIVEDTAKGSRRGPRIRALYRAVAVLAEREQVEFQRISRAEVHKAFAFEHARTRPEIARVIAAKIPALALRLPPLRKIWMSEDPRQSLFDAAALGAVRYASLTRTKAGTPPDSAA